MIKSFRSKALDRLWTRNDPRGIRSDQVRRVTDRLFALNRATAPEDMNLPGYFFHVLTGQMAGRYSVRISGNWRLTLGWDETGPDAIDVDFEDYH